MAKFSHSVEIPRPPAEVFPWLLEQDKVPVWTGHLEAYERLDDGEMGRGSRVRQVLEVSGRRIDVELEVTTYDPPNGAETRFSTNGIEVVNAYELSGSQAGTRSPSRSTPSPAASPRGCSSRSSSRGWRRSSRRTSNACAPSSRARWLIPRPTYPPGRVPRRRIGTR